MSNMVNKLKDWLSDPFGKEKLKRKHSEVIQDMQITARLTRKTTERVTDPSYSPRFPIGHMIGSSNPTKIEVTVTDKQPRRA